MDEEIKVDEYEGGVRSPVLYRLVQSVRHTGSRKGQSVPVCGVTLGVQDELITSNTKQSTFLFS